MMRARVAPEPACTGCGRTPSQGATILDATARPAAQTCSVCAATELRNDELTSDLARTLELWRESRRVSTGELDEQLTYMGDEAERRKWRERSASERPKGLEV